MRENQEKRGLFAVIINTMVFFIISFFVVPYFLSAFIVDESIQVLLQSKLKELSCNLNYKKRKASLFNPFEFYSNIDYWISDFRISNNYLIDKNQKYCFFIIVYEAEKLNKSISVSFVDESGDVSSKIYFKKKE